MENRVNFNELPVELWNMIYPLLLGSTKKELEEVLKLRKLSHLHKQIIDDVLTKPENSILIIAQLTPLQAEKFVMYHANIKPRFKNDNNNNSATSAEANPLQILWNALSTDNIHSIKSDVLQNAISCVSKANTSIKASTLENLNITLAVIRHTEESDPIKKSELLQVLNSLLQNRSAEAESEFINLAGSQLQNISLYEPNFKNANMLKANLANTVLILSRWQQDPVAAATFNYAILREANLYNLQCAGLNSYLDFFNCDLSYADLTLMNFNQCKWLGSNLYKFKIIPDWLYQINSEKELIDELEAILTNYQFTLAYYDDAQEKLFFYTQLANQIISLALSRDKQTAERILNAASQHETFLTWDENFLKKCQRAVEQKISTWLTFYKPSSPSATPLTALRKKQDEITNRLENEKKEPTDIRNSK